MRKENNKNIIQYILYNRKISLEEIFTYLYFLTFSLEENFTISGILDSEIEVEEIIKSHNEISEKFLLVKILCYTVSSMSPFSLKVFMITIDSL